MGNVHTLPGIQLQADPDSPTLPEEHVRRLAGGAKRPKDQLRILHAHGYVRAWRMSTGGRVILERAHVDAVQRGQFGQQQAANEDVERPRAAPNRAGFREKFGKKGKA